MSEAAAGLDAAEVLLVIVEEGLLAKGFELLKAPKPRFCFWAAPGPLLDAIVWVRTVLPEATGRVLYTLD